MLRIVVPAAEFFDEGRQVFVYTKEQTLLLEHSLVSISKWESKWQKAFLSKGEKTYEETIDYIRCMTVTPHVDPEVYNRLTIANINEVNRYIEAPMTATHVSEDKSGRRSHEIVTSELIYYWMILHGIPFECEKWHLNRLLMLIRVCERKNTPPKKRSQEEIARDYAAVNAARRKKLNSKG